MLKLIMGSLLTISGILSVISSTIVMRFWLITLIIMTLLKLFSVVTIPWFGGLFVASAIGTGLWMLFGGFFIMLISFVITALGVVILDN